MIASRVEARDLDGLSTPPRVTACRFCSVLAMLSASEGPMGGDMK